MEKQTVQAKVKSGDRAGEIFAIEYEMPGTIDEARQKWGDDVAFSQLKAAVVISLQSFMRQQIQKDGATTDSVQAACQEWSPSKGRGPARPISERAQELLGRMSIEERQALLEEFLPEE